MLPTRRAALLPLAALTTLTALSPAQASTRTPAELEPWVGHPAEGPVRALHSLGLTVVHGEGVEAWTSAEIDSMLAGAQAVPGFMLKALPRGMKLARRRQSCLYGMGRYTKACPTFSSDGKTFYIYDATTARGEGSIRRYKPLVPEERAMLQHRRAVVHAIVHTADKRFKWSDTPHWRLINGWPDNGNPPLNSDTWAYSRYLGMRTPRLDLVTFAEEYFVRPEDVLRDSKLEGSKKRLDKLDPNISLDCQEFTKIRRMQGFIAKKDPAWKPPERLLNAPYDSTLSTKATCPEFEKWADLKHVEGVDILLAAATSDRPESLYGHLLLQVRYKSGEAVRSRGFEPVYQYGAVTDTDVSKFDYFTKGLFGGFYSVIQPNTFRGIDRLFLQYEQRALRRYKLNLTPQKLTQVMERLWESERHITYSYYFLSDNCASMLIDLLAPSVDTPLPDPIRFAMMPTEVLDVLASARTPQGPLLVKRAETHFSSREVAMDAVPRRRAALARLIETLKLGGTEQAKTLQALDAALDERDPKVRRDAYKQMMAALKATLASAKITPPADSKQLKVIEGGAANPLRHAVDYLYFSTRIERYFMDVAFYQKRMLFVQAHKQPFRMTAEAQLAMRRELFMEEDIMKRQEAILQWARLGDERLREAERRKFTPEEQAKLARLDMTRDAYLASLDTLATIIEAFIPNLDGVRYIDDKLKTFEREQARRDDMSMGPPGKGRYMVGAGWGSTSTGGQSAWLDLNVAMIDERLGEQRRRGFRSDIESRALAVDGLLRLDDRLLKEMRLDVTAFRFISIEQRMGPVQRSWTDIFGWGIDVKGQHDGRRGLDFALNASLGYVYPIWTRDSVASFLIAGLYGDLNIMWGESRNTAAVGAKAYLMGQLHLYGRYGNVLRGEVITQQHFDSQAIAHQWSLTGRLSTHHVLAEFNQQVLLLKPYVEAERFTLDFTQGAAEPFTAWRGGLLVELPL